MIDPEQAPAEQPSFFGSVNVVMATYAIDGALALATSIIIAREVGPDGRGAYGLFVLTAAFGAMLLGLGIGNAAIYYLNKRELTLRDALTAAHTITLAATLITAVIVAIVGNAAEHSSAILMSVKDRMDLALGIAIGSATQIALFAAPLLVLLSYAIGPEPMDLVFTTAEVVAVAVSVLIVGQVAEDGESNWLEGVQLLAVYLILAVMFYFLPEASLAVE